jgi:hypothetical protein
MGAKSDFVRARLATPQRQKTAALHDAARIARSISGVRPFWSRPVLWRVRPGPMPSAKPRYYDRATHAWPPTGHLNWPACGALGARIRLQHRSVS